MLINFLFAIRPRGNKTTSILNSVEHEIYPVINVKMQTIVGILTLISMINTTSVRLKARNFFISQYFNFYEKSFITSGPGPNRHFT